MMFSGNVAALTSTTAGIYMFTHKHLQTKKYVAMSRTAYHDLVLMFHRLYEKNDDKLNSLEWEIKFNSPNASQWVFRIYSVANSEMLEVEANRRIILNNTLQPAGLNTEVMFSSKESFYNFAEVYAQMQRKNASKFINPIRQVCWISVWCVVCCVCAIRFLDWFWGGGDSEDSMCIFQAPCNSF